MKKRILLFIFTLLFIFSVAKSYAATPNPTQKATASATRAIEEEQINKLKDRIASRVAELKLVERRGIIGAVTESSNTQLTLTDLQSNTRFVDVDELTKFASPSAKESFGISDITKGDTIGILGLYNKQTRRLLARFIDVQFLPKVIHGAISAIDKDNFTITIINNNQETLLIDVQTTTKIFSYTKNDGLIKSGFSKIKVGERILVIGFPDKKDKTKIIPNRLTFFPELLPNPHIVLLPTQAPTITPEAKTSSATGSAKKTTK